MNVLFLVCLFDSGCCLTGVCLCCRAADVNLLAVLAEKDEIIAELRQEGKHGTVVKPSVPLSWRLKSISSTELLSNHQFHCRED